MKGSVLKRCGCPVELDSRGRRKACKKSHGSWYFVADVSEPGGRRQQVKRGGFPTKAEAERALASVLDQAARGPIASDGGQRVGEYLDAWVEAKAAAGLRTNTIVGYRHHIRRYLRPHLGHHRLRDLRPTHVEEMLRAIAESGGKGGSPLGAASIRRLHATLRSAMSSATRKRLSPYNPAADLDLPRVHRPKVQPGEPAELGAFLDAVAGDRLSPVFETVAATGLRRGEALGLRWQDIDLERGVLVVRQQLMQVSDTTVRQPCPFSERVHKSVVFGKPKTASGEDRMVEVDSGTIGVLLRHRLEQDEERRVWSTSYDDHDLVFAREDGRPIDPGVVTKRFRELTDKAGLRPVRLHDLRHGAASLRLAAGVDIAVVSKQLGHSTITLTSDTYSHLLQDVGRKAAERAMALVPRARDVVPDPSCDQSVTSGPSGGFPEGAEKALTCGFVAPPSGLEPETLRLTVACSAN